MTSLEQVTMKWEQSTETVLLDINLYHSCEQYILYRSLLSISTIWTRFTYICGWKSLNRLKAWVIKRRIIYILAFRIIDNNDSAIIKFIFTARFTWYVPVS